MLTRRSPIVYAVPAVAPPLPYSPLALWHLLSLDAPTVAVIWTLFTARLTLVPVPRATVMAMALAVWTLYAADRLLDSRPLSGPSHRMQANELELRHLFHLRHRAAFLVGIGLATALLAALLPRLGRSAIHLYLIEAVPLAGYFLLIHGSPAYKSWPLPKELLVGLFFSAATFVPTISRSPALRPILFPCALLFTALCTLNCLFIYVWEHPASSHPHPLTQAVLCRLPRVGAAILVAAVALTAGPLPLYPAGCALSVTILLSLHGARRRLSRLTLRAAADAALLTPILFLPFL